MFETPSRTRKRKKEAELNRNNEDNILNNEQSKLHDDHKNPKGVTPDFHEPPKPEIEQVVNPIVDQKPQSMTLETISLDDEIKRFRAILNNKALTKPSILEKGNSVLDEVAIVRCYYSQKANLDTNIDKTLAHSLKCCSDYLDNPSSSNKDIVVRTAENLPNKSSVCKKLFGAMLALAGVTLIAAAAVAVVFSLGTSAVPSFMATKLGVGLISLGAGVIGSSTISGGAYLFHNGSKKHSLSKKIIGIVDSVIPSPN